jgi:hypothetical protein
MAVPVIGGLIDIGKTVAKGIFGDKAEGRKFQHEFEVAMLKEGSAILQIEINKQAEIISAEAHGDKWQRRWRPTLMYACIAIIVNNFILQPYLQAIFGWSVTLTLPPELWKVMMIGIGGYIGSRGVEKVVKVWKNGANNG